MHQQSHALVALFKGCVCSPRWCSPALIASAAVERVPGSHVSQCTLYSRRPGAAVSRRLERSNRHAVRILDPVLVVFGLRGKTAEHAVHRPLAHDIVRGGTCLAVTPSLDTKAARVVLEIRLGATLHGHFSEVGPLGHSEASAQPPKKSARPSRPPSGRAGHKRPKKGELIGTHRQWRPSH